MKYGLDFFECNQCKCETCQTKTLLEEEKDHKGCTDVSNAEFFSSNQPLEEFSEKTTSKFPSKKRRGRRVRKCFSVKVRNFLSSILTPAKFAKESSFDGGSSISQSSSLTCEEDASLRGDSSTDECVDKEKRFLLSSFQETSRAPSPHFTDEVLSVHQQEHGNCQSVETSQCQSEHMYAGASFDYSTFDTMLRSFSLNFHLDDSATIGLLKMFKLSLPQSAKIPFPHSTVYRMKKGFHDFSTIISLDTGSYCSLSFSKFLKHVVEQNWCNLVKYAERRNSCHVPDIPLDKVCSNWRL